MNGPGDQLDLWWLGQPQAPVRIGTLQMVRALRGVSLRYDEAWLQRGFALSEDLPLTRGEFLPHDKDSAAGAVDDARPDRWGERLIRFLQRPPRLSLLEFLYFAGDDRFGALGVSWPAEVFQPHRLGPLPTLADVPALQALVRKVLANEPVPEAEKRLLLPGATMGGARPKALLQMEGLSWVVKFSDIGEALDMPLIEHAAMTLAGQAGIDVATTRALPLGKGAGHAVAVQRFDRLPQGQRLHALSAKVALQAAGEPMGYPELAQLLRRRGVAEGGVNRRQMQELFRRMVFNILIDNTDDHEKNHVLLVQAPGRHWTLSPAFDVLPSAQALGYQQMRVGEQGADATLDNALSMSRLFALKPDEAVQEVRRVCRVVQGWRAHFKQVGVQARHTELLAEQIERPFLRQQRDGF